MAHVIRVRDVAREGLYEFGPEEPILRGPYDLFQFPAEGAVQKNGELVDWAVAGGEVRTGRVTPASMGDVRPGERVLVKLPPAVPGVPEVPEEKLRQSRSKDDEWWLCEIESVDGIAVAQ
jgi:hypothetical protein